MPTKIKIILPATHGDDVLSSHDDAASNDTSTHGDGERHLSYEHTFSKHTSGQGGGGSDASTQADIQPSTDKRNQRVTLSSKSQETAKRQMANKVLHGPRCPSDKRGIGTNKSMKEFEDRGRNIRQVQHQLQQGVGEKTVIQTRTTAQARPASARPATREAIRIQQMPVDNVNDFRLSVTDTYDVDLEHHDIMLKAFHAYRQHRHLDDSRRRGTRRTKSRLKRPQTASYSDNSGINRDENLQLIIDHLQREGEIFPDDSLDSDSSKTFKLAQCRLQFNEDLWAKRVSEDERKGRHKRSPARTVTLYPPATSDGVLVDSVGHQYGHRQQRPWSALPCKFSYYRQMLANGERKRSDVTSTPSVVPVNEFNAQLNNGKPHVVTLTMADKTNQPITRSEAYQRRNQTTHTFCDGMMMSRSMPNASFLHRQYVGLTSPHSPRYSVSEQTSPAGKATSTKRPNSSYSYDGGFFVGAHSGQADYFVIHPDWVSEAMTIKKLTIGSKHETAPKVHHPKLKSRTWHNRRCMSAPPSKIRNPITWEQSDPINIPRK